MKLLSIFTNTYLSDMSYVKPALIYTPRVSMKNARGDSHRPRMHLFSERQCASYRVSNPLGIFIYTCSPTASLDDMKADSASISMERQPIDEVNPSINRTAI